MTVLIVGFVTFLLSLFCVWLVGVVAYRKQWIVAPRQDRWSTRPVALYGGIGIFLAFFFGFAFLLTVFKFGSLPQYVFPFLIGSVAIFFVGLADDRLTIKPSTKLIGQIIAVSIPIVAGLTVALTPWHLINVLLTFLWFLIVINAINLIDNMDGLASGVVMIATLTLLALRVLDSGFQGQSLVFGIEVLFLYAIGGFWIFNRYPARIFMGDSGSLFLGYMLAGLALFSAPQGLLKISSAIFALLLPAAVLAVPLFDTMLVSIMRVLHGRPVSVGGKDHSSHRLVGLGFSESAAVLILYGLAAIGGIIAVALRMWPHYSIIFGVLYVFILVFLGLYLGHVKTYPESDTAMPKTRWTPPVTEFLYKRHAAEVLLDFVLISLSYYLAYYLRFEGALQTYGQTELYIQSLPIIITSCLFSFYLCGVYRGIWHFITVADIGRYVKGVISGVSIAVFLIAVFYRFEGYSRAVFFIFGTLLFLMMVGSRLSFRILDDSIRRRTSGTRLKNVVIYGAGQGGKFLYEECMRNLIYKEYRIVGFVDDSIEKQHLNIMGFDISESGKFVSQMAEKESPIHELWVSSSKISNDKVIVLRGALERHAAVPITVRRFKIGFEEVVDIIY